MEFGNLNLHLGNFFSPGLLPFWSNTGEFVTLMFEAIWKNEKFPPFSPEVEKCKKRPHLFFLLRFGFNRDPFFVPNSNRSSLNPPKAHPSKTNPMKATLLKARPSKANPLRANSFEADSLNLLKVSPLKADPLQANPLKPNHSRANPLKVSPQKLSLCRLSVQRPILWRMILRGQIPSRKILFRWHLKENEMLFS